MAFTDAIECKAWLLGRFIAKTLASFSLDNVRENLSKSFGVETAIKLSSSGFTCGNKHRSFGRVGLTSVDRMPFRFYDLSLVNNVYQDQLKAVLVCIVRLADIREYNYEILVFRLPFADDVVRFQQLFRMLTFAESPNENNPVKGRDIERVEKVSPSRDPLSDNRKVMSGVRGESLETSPKARQVSEDDRRHLTVPEKAPRHSLAAKKSTHRHDDVNNNNIVSANRELSRKTSQRSVQRNVGFDNVREADRGYIEDDVVYVRDVGTSTKPAMLPGRYDSDGDELIVTAEPAVCELFCHCAKVYRRGGQNIADVFCQATIIFSMDDDDVTMLPEGEISHEAVASSFRGRDSNSTKDKIKTKSKRHHKSQNLDSVVEIEEASDSREDELTTERSSEEGDYAVKQYLGHQSHTILDTGTVRVTVEPPQDEDDDLDGLDNDIDLTLDGRIELRSENNDPIYSAPIKNKRAQPASDVIQAEIHSDSLSAATRKAEGAVPITSSTAADKPTSQKGGTTAGQLSGTLRQKLAEKSKRDSRAKVEGKSGKVERKPSSEKNSFTLGSLWRKSSTVKKNKEVADVEPGTAKITIDTSSDTLLKKSVKIDPSSIHVIREPESTNGYVQTQKSKEFSKKKDSKSSGWDGRHSSMDSLNFSSEPARLMLSRKSYGRKTAGRPVQSFDESQLDDRQSDDIEVRPSSRNHLIATTSYDNNKMKERNERRDLGRSARSGRTYSASEKVISSEKFTSQENSNLDEWDGGSGRVYARMRPKSYSSDQEDSQAARMVLSSEEARRIRLLSPDQERPKSRSTLILNSYASPRIRSDEEQMRTSEIIRDMEQKRKKIFSAEHVLLPRGRVYTSERDLRSLEHRGNLEEFGRSGGVPSEENYRDHRSAAYEPQAAPRTRLQSVLDGGTGYESDRLRGGRSNTYVDPDPPRAIFRKKGAYAGYDSGELPQDRIVLVKGGGGGGSGTGWTRRVPSETGGRVGDSAAVSHSRSYSVSRADKYNRRPVNW